MPADSDITEATTTIREFTGSQTKWERCDDDLGQRFRFAITRDVLIWVRPDWQQERSVAVAALRTLAARASELADAIQMAGED